MPRAYDLYSSWFPPHTNPFSPRLEDPYIVSYYGHEFVMGAQGGPLLS